jgi:uncharacterized membrane protein
MRFFKKRFLSGIIVIFILWLLLGLFKIFLGVLEPAWDFINLFIKTEIITLNIIISFFLLILCIFILGSLARVLSRRTPSKVPVLSQILKFSKFVQTITHRLETGEIKSASVSLGNGLNLVGFTTGETIMNINGEDMVAVLLPSTPNPTTGYSFLVPKDKIIILSEYSNNSALKIILTAGLIK